MAEPTVLDLILRSQERVEDKIDTNTTAVIELKTRVDTWERQQSGAQSVHDKCREEVEEAFRENKTDHGEFRTRLGKLENCGSESRGERKGVSLMWKVVAGVIATIYTVLLIIELVHGGV